MTSAVDVIREELAEIKTQLASYDELVARRERLSKALDVLEGRSGSTRRRRGTLGASSIDREKIIAALRSHHEMPADYIRDQLALDQSSSNTLSRVLKQMVDDGLLRRTGERRATRYSVAKP